MTGRIRHPFDGLSARWLIVVGAALVLFGAAGSRFSFGVFLRPLTEEFGWSRGSLAGALAMAGLATAGLRPLAGAMADRYDPVKVALFGLVLAGAALAALSQINQLWQLYALFLVMGAGFTLASPATLTKLVSSAFTRRRSLALSLAGSGSAIGETMLVPTSAVVLTLSGWRSAYLVLGGLLLIVIIPLAFRMLRTKHEPEEPGDGGADGASLDAGKGPVCAWMPDEGMSLKQAAKTPIFWALTAGFFT